MKAQFAIPLAIFAVWGLAGCGKAPDAAFSPNTQKLKPLIQEARDKIAESLLVNFGTPNQLVAWEKFPIDYGKPAPQADSSDDRSEPGWRLKLGRNYYMQHCQHCHGVSGDGNGPTARFLNPLPRDYRLGKFKFKSTHGPMMPSRNDLKHILEQGIPGTYMPSFVLLGDEKLELIVDYVRWLSIRGNMEIRMAQELATLFATEKDVAQALLDDETKKLKRSDVIADVKKSMDTEFPGIIDNIAAELAEAWTTADLPESAVVPTRKRKLPTPKSIDNGKKLFLSQVEGKKTECTKCHGLMGRGDGSQTEEFLVIKDSNPEQKYEVVGLHDDWGHPIRPRDLTRGIYRGGRRPIDIYRRVHEGIPGTPMSGFASVLKPEEIWDVVNYVLSIPFDGKQSAYPTELNEEEDKKEVVTTEN